MEMMMLMMGMRGDVYDLGMTFYLRCFCVGLAMGWAYMSLIAKLITILGAMNQ
jgi:hypothetical protein